MRINRGTIVLGIAGQIRGINSTAAIECHVIVIELFVEAYLCAHVLRAEIRAADDSIRSGHGWRGKRAVEIDVVDETSRARSSTGDYCRQAREGIRGARGKRIEIIDARLGKSCKVWTVGLAVVYACDAVGTIGEVERMHAVDADE